MLATEVHRRFISDCNGRNPRSGAASPLRRLASLWCRASRFWAVIPPGYRGSWRPVLAQTAATLQVSTPGFWVVLQENGLEFDALPGVLGGYFGSSLRFASMATV